MAYEILMPQLGLTMEEGTVSQWLKREGDAVKAGENLIEIETDKLVNSVQSEFDGILLKIIAQNGDEVPVKGLLGYIGEAGENVGTSAPAAVPVSAVPVAEPVATTPIAAATSAGGARIRISPLARKTAAKLGIDPHGIAGSGSAGRITQKDILAAAETMKAQPAAKPEVKPVALPKPDAPVSSGLERMDGDTVVRMTAIRKVVAQRMLQSHTEIPPVTQVTKVDVTELTGLRKTLFEQTGKKFSVNDLIIAATAKALRAHPEVLVSYDGNQIIQRAHVNIGMAVALDCGLIVPVIRDADKLPLEALSAAAKDLAVRAKENKLTPDEYKGSTFTVTNLGMFGIESFTPIINQPDAAILGVGCTQDELQMDEHGSIVKRQVMRLSCTYDHRLLDGAVAARFVADLRDILQSPIRILV